MDSSEPLLPFWSRPVCRFPCFVCKGSLKILQVRLQQYVNHELPDVQAGFRKGRAAKDQIAEIPWPGGLPLLRVLSFGTACALGY